MTLPCGGIHRERLDATAEDGERGFKRAEHLRQQPKGTPAYKRMYGWRADTEATHNTLDTGMYRQRMIVDKLADQQLVMIGHALARNAIAAATVRAHTALNRPAGTLAA